MKTFRNILVTGGAGYVGSTLVSALLREGYGVTVLDTLAFGGLALMPYFADKKFRFVKGDIRDKKTVERAMEGIDAVIHLAGIVGFPACRKDPEGSRDINVRGTQTVVDALPKHVPVLFASTGSNYGKMLEKVCTELSTLNPLSDYAKQKVEAEEIIKKHGEFVIYRFATAFGVSSRMRLDLLPNDFTYRAVREKTLIVYEKNFMRTFIHVRDMAYAFIFALQNYDRMRGEIYNVGSNNMNYSKEAICHLIKNRVDYYLHFADVGHDLDQRDYMVSYDKIHALGFAPTVSMDEGIDELIKASEVIEIKNPYYNV
ncbi:MAG: epimerase [Candidatus Liptonbacteria bacterium RIFCSPLOWO2_01_FULL_53_13]|uniref:Epimerase n=1 Tax=Candidatus Liptonbacteria bacterium RIFCSPLOWO2_01_FULL_53_13 TaxID=1798651 RepID=A0A1G2CLU9_9BACT|nr:MAG: epimerase [Candidatus Liptonbacteria bacterium RIFCSPLOWO2_01_FULL_53_13]